MYLQRHAATQAAFFSTPRDARIATEYRRLRQGAAAFVNSMPGMAVLGDDPFVSHLVSASGFAPHDVVVMRIAINGAKVTLICAPTRIWRNADDRADIIRIKREVAAVGSKCILVPQRWVRNGVRTTFANAIAAARGTRFVRKDERAVMTALLCGPATIGSCASCIPDHPDPYGVVLSMAASGLLHIDRSGKLGSDTGVRLPAARRH